jgi:hypothetical protein
MCRYLKRQMSDLELWGIHHLECRSSIRISTSLVFEVTGRTGMFCILGRNYVSLDIVTKRTSKTQFDQCLVSGNELEMRNVRNAQSRS